MPTGCRPGKRIVGAARAGVFIAAASLVLTGLLAGTPRGVRAAEYDCGSEQSRGEPTRLELTLPKKLKKQSKQIRETFRQEAPDVKVRIEFMPFLDPPKNIGIGRCVSADTARWAMQQAMEFNGGIDRVILQNVVPHHWVGIGTTKLAELSWMPISPADLERLRDPGLSTEAFHALYNELARMTERKRPFGFEPIPYEERKDGQTTPLPDPEK